MTFNLYQYQSKLKPKNDLQQVSKLVNDLDQ